jgi:hypothetical protein
MTEQQIGDDLVNIEKCILINLSFILGILCIRWCVMVSLNLIMG